MTDLLDLALALGIIVSGASASMPAGGFEGNPLWCDGKLPEYPHGSLTYSLDEEWFAMPIQLYEEGLVHCGDRIMVQDKRGKIWVARALDASELHVKLSYLGLPFVVEAPEHMGIGTMPVTVVNLTRLERLQELRP